MTRLFGFFYTFGSWTHQWMAFYSHAQAETYLNHYFYDENIVIKELTWRQRESHWFNSDDSSYRYPVWTNELRSIDDHYPHISLTDPTMIAFTESHEKGEADIQTTMKPGKYLKKYYPDLTPMKIEYYATWFKTGNRPAPVVDATLKFANTPDEFVEVYNDTRYISSCMSNAKWVQVYGAGDLALAYMENPQQRVQARALCWPERKVFGRLYPDGGEFRQALEAQLRAKGYKSLQETDNEGFNGARLLRIERGPYLMMPYIDSSIGVDIDPTTNEPTLQYSGYDYSADHTGGILQTYRTQHCAVPGCTQPAGPYGDVRRAYIERHDSDPDYDHYENSGVICEKHHHQTVQTFYTGTRYHPLITPSLTKLSPTYGPNKYEVLEYLNIHGFQCAYDKDWYVSKEYYGRPGPNGEIWHTDNLRDQTFTCKIDGKVYLNSEMSKIHRKCHVSYDSTPREDPTPTPRTAFGRTNVYSNPFRDVDDSLDYMDIDDDPGLAPVTHTVTVTVPSRGTQFDYIQANMAYQRNQR